MGKLIVLAIGGNSLIIDKNHMTVEDQYKACAKTCEHIADLVEEGYKILITHGNGPQVGFILRRAELAKNELHMVPLDSCDADTQGAIGYQIQKALGNILKVRNIKKDVVTVVTQVLVDIFDPSFKNPTKPIGSFMDEETAKKRIKENGWDVIQDAGRGFRRVVPSPEPTEIIELNAIMSLLSNNFIVVAAGGGGIPVARDDNGLLFGVEAVIDKDKASALLALNLKADCLIISTAVKNVSLNYGKENEMPLSRINLENAKKYIREGHFAKGSMLPKIEAIVSFVERTNKRAIVTNPQNLLPSFKGKEGTTICP